MSSILYDTSNKELVSDLINDQNVLIDEQRFIIDQQSSVINDLMNAFIDLQSVRVSVVKAANMKNAINITAHDLREV